MEMTQKWVGLAGEKGLRGRLSHCRQQSWTQSWKCKWTVDQHLALADCYHVGIWAWRFSIDARNMDFHVKHQDFFSLSKLQTYNLCKLFLKWMCGGGGKSQMTEQKEWHGHHFATITKNKQLNDCGLFFCN